MCHCCCVALNRLDDDGPPLEEDRRDDDDDDDVPGPLFPDGDDDVWTETYFLRARGDLVVLGEPGAPPEYDDDVVANSSVLLALVIREVRFEFNELSALPGKDKLPITSPPLPLLPRRVPRLGNGGTAGDDDVDVDDDAAAANTCSNPAKLPVLLLLARRVRLFTRPPACAS